MPQLPLCASEMRSGRPWPAQCAGGGRAGGAGYKYQEVVRRKAARELLRGFECQVLLAPSLRKAGPSLRT